jgi:hypothetical protein
MKNYYLVNCYSLGLEHRGIKVVIKMICDLYNHDFISFAFETS